MSGPDRIPRDKAMRDPRPVTITLPLKTWSDIQYTIATACFLADRLGHGRTRSHELHGLITRAIASSPPDERRRDARNRQHDEMLRDTMSIADQDNEPASTIDEARTHPRLRSNLSGERT